MRVIYMEQEQIYKVMTRIMDVFEEEKCSVEDIKEILANIMPVIERCSTLQNQSDSYLNIINDMFTYDYTFHHNPYLHDPHF